MNEQKQLNNMENKTIAQELREALNGNIVSFSYTKKNGEWREAIGTRNPTLLEHLHGEVPKGTGTEKDGTIAYWDVDSNGWRSCREDSIIAINGIRSKEEYEANLD